MKFPTITSALLTFTLCSVVKAAIIPVVIDNYIIDFAKRINSARAKNGLSPICIDGNLVLASQRHAKYLFDKQIASHIEKNDSPYFSGEKFDDRARASGFNFQTLFENVMLGCDDVDCAYDRFMKSPGHRANILATDAVSFGVWHVQNRDGKASTWSMTLGKVMRKDPRSVCANIAV